MSEKRVFEGLVLEHGSTEGIVKPYLKTDKGDKEGFGLLFDFVGTKVRVTIEPLPVAPETTAPKKKLTLEEADAMVAEGRHPIEEGYEIEGFNEHLIRLVYESTTMTKPAPGPGADDSNDPEQERFKQKVKQFEEDCKRPRPDIAKAIQDEFRKRFKGGGA